MNITSDIKPVTYLKSKTADLLKQINDTHRPVIITQNGEPRAVIQDPKSYENMRNAIGLLKLISQGENDIREGRVKSQEEVFNDLEKLLLFAAFFSVLFFRIIFPVVYALASSCTRTGILPPTFRAKSLICLVLRLDNLFPLSNLLKATDTETSSKSPSKARTSLDLLRL